MKTAERDVTQGRVDRRRDFVWLAPFRLHNFAEHRYRRGDLRRRAVTDGFFYITFRHLCAELFSREIVVSRGVYVANFDTATGGHDGSRQIRCRDRLPTDDEVTAVFSERPAALMHTA